MPNLELVARFSFTLEDERTWFTDRKVTGAVVDAVLSTMVGKVVTHAGPSTEERKVAGVAAARKAIVTGKQGSFSAIDAPDPDDARTSIAFDFDTDGLVLQMTIGPDVVAEHADTILATIAGIGVAVVEAMEDVAPLGYGSTYPDAEGFTYPRVRPPVVNRTFDPSSILDFIDARTEKALAKAKVPAGVQRSVHGDLVVNRWVDSMRDERAVALAAGRHEQWLAGLVPMQRASGFNEHGDRRVDLAKRTERAPFTMFDAASGIGYKAVVVDPKGAPIDDTWDEMVAVAKKLPKGVQGIRLIVPLRKLALTVAARARAAGFDAVLYPGEDNKLWDPQPAGWWIDDEAKPAKKRQ